MHYNYNANQTITFVVNYYAEGQPAASRSRGLVGGRPRGVDESREPVKAARIRRLSKNLGPGVRRRGTGPGDARARPATVPRLQRSGKMKKTLS